MGDIKGEMNMYADDISVSETEVKGKLKKIKNSEEYRKFEQNEQRQAEKNGTWMHLEIDSHSSNEEFARVTAAVFMSRMNPTMEELEDQGMIERDFDDNVEMAEDLRELLMGIAMKSELFT